MLGCLDNLRLNSSFSLKVGYLQLELKQRLFLVDDTLLGFFNQFFGLFLHLFILFGDALIDLVLELYDISEILSLQVANMLFESMPGHGLLTCVTLDSHNLAILLDMVETFFDSLEFFSAVRADSPLHGAVGRHVAHQVNDFVRFVV